MHINTIERTLSYQTSRADQARATRAPSPMLSRIDYRRMVAEILG